MRRRERASQSVSQSVYINHDVRQKRRKEISRQADRQEILESARTSYFTVDKSGLLLYPSVANKLTLFIDLD